MAGIPVHQKNSPKVSDRLVQATEITLDGTIQNLAVTLGSNTQYAYAVLLQSSNANAAIVFVGGSPLTPTNGFELNPGESIPITPSDLRQLNVTGTPGDIVKVGYWTDSFDPTN